MSPGELLPIQDLPKRPPLDLIRSPKGLLRRCQTAVRTFLDHSWTLLESTSKKTRFLHSFSEHREMPSFIRFPAHRGNRALPNTTIFALPSPSGAPRERLPFSQDPPWTPPKLTLELLGVPRDLSRTPNCLQGPHQIHKADMLKTLEICVFDLLGSQKNAPGEFFDPPRTTPNPSGIATLAL